VIADAADTFGILIGVFGPILLLYVACSCMIDRRGMRLYGLAIYVAAVAFLLPRAGTLGRREVSNEIVPAAMEALALLGLVLFVKAGLLAVAGWRRRRAGMLDP
jgi:hypothetical protein